MNKDLLTTIILISIMIGILGYGVWFAFVPTPQMMDEIHESLVTNQTHRNSIPCSDLELAIASGNQQMALNKPTKLIEELKKIAKERDCKFQRPDLWLDGYIGENEN